MLIRLLGISAVSISGLLSNLADIVNDYTISEREGLYAWTVRHAVIAAIVSKYKFHDTSEIIRLFEKVIDAISPTYEIEIRTVRELCNIEYWPSPHSGPGGSKSFAAENDVGRSWRKGAEAQTDSELDQNGRF